jgi:hypothetical protein
LRQPGLTPRVRDLAQRFIAHNHNALIDYWECRISTAAFLARIGPPPR